MFWGYLGLWVGVGNIWGWIWGSGWGLGVFGAAFGVMGVNSGVAGVALRLSGKVGTSLVMSPGVLGSFLEQDLGY